MDRASRGRSIRSAAATTSRGPTTPASIISISRLCRAFLALVIIVLILWDASGGMLILPKARARESYGPAGGVSREAASAVCWRA